MYNIYADGVCIYNDIYSLDDMKVSAPKLILEDNAAGSLSMTLPPSNKAYQTIARMITDISVEKDGEEIWSGRVLSESRDFWNNRALYCEGALAFFNDSIQPPKEYSGLTIRGYMEELIEAHNARVNSNRQFTLGAVTVYDDSFPVRYSNYEKTIELLNALVEQYGGHLRIRYENGVRCLDYLAECPDTCSQAIQFGSNLIEFTRNWDSTGFATALIPLGSRLEDSPIEALDAYLTVESVNNGSIYIQSDEAVAAYGWIEKSVTWDDVTDPSVLLSKAQAYLSDLQFDNMELEMSALDLHYMDVNAESVKLLDEIRVISRPHGLDRMFPVTKLEIPLDCPEKTQFKFGDSVKTSLTSVNHQINASITQKMNRLPKAHSILKEAQENATQIMNMATTGYITITKDDYGSETLYISNVRDYTAADKLWKWNMNGLGYSSDGGKTFGLAITMDGAIVANYITAGTLSGDRVRTGVIQSENANVVFDLTNGKLTMKSGSIEIGDNFRLSEDGTLFVGGRGTFAGTLSAAKGTFGGQLTAASGNFVGIVQAMDFLDQNGNSMMANSKFTADYLDLKGITIRNNSGEITFQVTSSGVVTVNGQITMGAGSSINWANVSHTSLSDNPAYNLADTAIGNAAVAQRKANSAYSLADDASTNAAAAWSRANTAYNARCTDQNVFDILTSGGTKFGIFSESYSGRLYINASYIRSGTISADYVDLSCEYGGFCKGHGYDGESTTYGAMMYGSNGPGWEPYIIVTNRGCRMSAGEELIVTANGVFASEELTIRSDARLKNSVSYNLEAYEKFFMSLKPTSFRYNDGISGRKHLGFIAQDVETALNEADISSAAFAAFVKQPVEEVRADGIEDYRYALRYGEFIALNTHMIQKLFRMVDRLTQERSKAD